ncbi:NUDIX domain-containing protein [Nocardia terpenica]|uniref:NUDIX domain-containing protein n=2 Tax=Nocardia terpenica TaxID=455432 RepID=A0A6G9ZIC7_9NOCA|nr:NUDIX domain-containing protein [Nocardia terpenica]
MNPVEPLYRRDPDAWRRHLAEGNATQPRKRVGADALVFDPHGRILLVDPNYKPDWDLPGGMAEANEPPDAAVCRELAEELGLHIATPAVKMLCLDWVSPHGPWDDSLMFIFDAGILDAHQVTTLQITDHELDAFEFCTTEQATERLRPYVWSRVGAALHARETNRTAYLHDGKEIW